MTTPVILHNNSMCWGYNPTGNAARQGKNYSCQDNLSIQFYLEIRSTNPQGALVQVRGFCRNCIYPAMVEFNKDKQVIETKVLNEEEYEVYKVMDQ